MGLTPNAATGQILVTMSNGASIRTYATRNNIEDSAFHLTRYSNFLNSSGKAETTEEDGEGSHHQIGNLNKKIPDMGKFFDCTLKPLAKNLEQNVLLNTIQQTQVIVDNPFTWGMIACSDVLSNVYACGIQCCDMIKVNVILSTEIQDEQHDGIVQSILNGFMDRGKLAGVEIIFGSLSIDRFCIIGSSATAMLAENECNNAHNAVDGDVVILTKPLGTYAALTAYKWRNDPSRWNKIKSVVNPNEIETAYDIAVNSMTKLNYWAAGIYHKYEVHSATKVSNLGILGHAQILASRQNNPVSITIHNLPIITKMAAVSRISGAEFQIVQGKCPEISGGLLLCLSQKNAAAFRSECEKELMENCWIVGRVKEGNRTAEMIRKPRIIDFPSTK